MEEIDFKILFYSLQKRISTMILLFLLVFATVGTYLYLNFNESYETKITILVPESNLTKSYSSLILDEDIIDEASSKLGISAAAIRNSIKIDNSQNSIFLIGLNVKMDTKQKSDLTADTLANLFIDKIKRLYKISNATIATKVQVTNELHSMSNIMNIVKKSSLYGLEFTAAYVILFIFVSFKNGKYANRNTIKEDFGMDVLYELPNFKANNIKKVKRYTLDQFKLLKKRIEHIYSKKEDRTILFVYTNPVIDMNKFALNLSEAFQSDNQKCFIEDFKESFNNLIVEVKDYDFKFVIAPNVVESSECQTLLEQYKNILLIEDSSDFDVERIARAKNVFDFYGIKNVKSILINKISLEEERRYKTFAKMYT